MIIRTRYDALDPHAWLHRLSLRPTVCFADPAPGGDPPAPPTPPANPPTPPANPPADPPKDPETITLTSAQLKERMERASAAKMRELGIDPDEYKRTQAELAELKKKEDERKKAEMTEVERLKAEKAELEAQKREADRLAKASADQAAIVQLCAEHGIRDVEYAKYRLKDIGEEERAAKLAEWMKDDTEKVRFGVGSATPPKKPATTGGTPPNEDPPKPPNPNDPNGGAAKPVDEMSPDEYQRYRKEKHGF